MTNQKTPTMSIIVCVFNVEKYIKKSIESVLNQSFKDFELLLINDGSEDSSGEICNEYALIDERVKVVHKQNAGISATRNDGLKIALGDYICFVDPDDWIENDVLKMLYEKSQDSDLVILTNACCDSPHYTEIREFGYTKEKYLHSDITILLEENRFFEFSEGAVWSKLFRRDIIQSHEMKFMLGNSFFEDHLFILEYLNRCESVSIAKGSHYHHVKRKDSLSSKLRPFKNYIETYDEGMRILCALCEKYDKKKESLFFSLGITKFLRLLNLSAYSLYARYKEFDGRDRIERLNYLSEINVAHARFFKPNGYKHKIVHNIIKFRNKKISDFILIVLFKFVPMRNLARTFMRRMACFTKSGPV